MADTEFSTLASTNTLAASDQLLVVRGGVAYRFVGTLPQVDPSGTVVVMPASATLGGFFRDVDAAVVGSVGAWIEVGARIGATKTPAAQFYGQLDGASTGQLALMVRNGGAMVERLRIDAGGAVRPGADNVQPLGTAGLRFSTVFAGSGTINTSDEREKTWRGGLNPKELAAAKAIGAAIGVFRFKDAVREKKAEARLHVGVKAQEVVALMKAAGLDPMRYAFVCHDKWKADKKAGIAAGDRYGIRYDELAMFLAAAQEQRLAALEAAA